MTDQNKRKGVKMIGPVKKKVLLLLFAGLTMSLSRSPRVHLKILKGVAKEWEEINRRSLRNAIRDLYNSHLIETISGKDGLLTLVLSEKGNKIALTYDLENMVINKSKKWDGKWRIVIFDIPESFKKVRDAVRFHLRHLGFIELQKSVFVLPYECKREIEYVIEFYNARRFIRFIVAESIDNELDIKNKFSL